MAARTHSTDSKQSAPSKLGSRHAGWLQRACACGQHTIGGSHCEACNKKRLQRRATSSAEPLCAPSVVEETLRSAGQPLDEETRAFMESRFTHDFSHVQAQRPAPQRSARGLTVGPSNDEFEQEADRVAARLTKREKIDERGAHNTTAPRVDFSRVRVHTDARAAESARMIDAVAYTVGHDVVFDAGQYAPSTSKGRELLAHELTHVVQQTGGGSQASASNVVQGKKRERIPLLSGIYDFFSNIIQTIFKPGFAPETLQEYLDTILATGQIEDSFDSDDKALGVYKLWKAGGDRTTIVAGKQSYPLTDKLRKLLSAELRSGGSAQQKSAAREFDDFKPEEAAATTAGQEAPSGDSLTKTEQDAGKMREALRGQVETVDIEGEKYQVGGIEADKDTQEDIKQKNLLFGKEDTAHIKFSGRKLGMDIAYTTPRDAFRWNLLKEIMATGKVDIRATGETDEFTARDAVAGHIDPPSPKTLSGLGRAGARGVTVYREELYRLVAGLGSPGSKDLVSTTGRDQIIYSRGYTSVAHELFGHLWLAMQGVPSGHGESLKGTHTIKDPFGEPFAGSVNDFITEYVQPSPDRPARRGEESPSRSLEVTQQKFKATLDDFVSALSEKDAFIITMGGAFTKPSKKVGNAWAALAKFYNLLLVNEPNEGQRISLIVNSVKSVYDKYDDDFSDAFERFLFARSAGWDTMRTDPKKHLATQLKIEDPTNRAPRKKKTSAPQGTGQTGKVQPKLIAPYRQEFAPPAVHAALLTTGHPLETSTRALMESRFQHDFSRVRVHTGEQADESARSINAQAYTVGQQIVFARNQYQPDTSTGTRLLSHELAHTIQQSSGAQIKDGVSHASDPFERHADEVAEAVAEGRSASQLLSAYQPSAGERSTGRALQRQARTTEQHSGRVGTDEETPESSSNPLVLAGVVGAGGMNSAEDVMKVQARLRALGLLSEADFEAESPSSATTTLPFEAEKAGGADSTTVSMPAINLPADSLRTRMPVDGPGSNTTNATLPSTPASTTPDAAQTVIPESSLTATILAIREFQRALFGKEAVDGNISPMGPTWRALATTDEASYAKMKEQWEAKKQQMKEEEERRKIEAARMKEEQARQQKEEEGRKKIEAERKRKAEEKKSTDDAKKILSTYATYLPLMSGYVSLDESGLARLLVIKAQHESATVLKVFDALQEDDALQVASEMVLSATVGELSEFALAVLLHLKTVIRFGEKSADTVSMLELINSAVMLQNKKALPPSKGSSVVEQLKEQIKAGRITFQKDFYGNPNTFRDMLLGDNIEKGKVTESLQKLVLYLSKLEPLQINSVFRSQSGMNKGLHDEGRAVDIGNIEIATRLLPQVATDEKVKELGIEQVIFDATVVGESPPQKWNYVVGVKGKYNAETMAKHRNHMHFGVKAK